MQAWRALLPGQRPGQRTGFWLLVAGVGLAHLLLANRLAEDRVGWGSGDAPPPRIEVAFVRELAAARPPAVVAPAVPAERRLAAVAAQPLAAASAPKAAASGNGGREPPPPPQAAAEPEPPPPPLPVPEPVPDLAARSVADAQAAAASAPVLPPVTAAVADPVPPTAATAVAVPAVPAAAASRPVVAFDWPPSTRMTYKLLGHYRGPVEGTAQVDWLRQGNRYQVHLSTAIGPVLSRHITSEGELTAQGLAPRRFDGEQKVVFRSPRRWQLRFEPEQVVLTDGSTAPTQAGVQDEASQFVQLTWLFTTQPQKLKVGSAVEMPLAISKRLDRWTYDVIAEEVLHFPFGDVPSFRLKPRREAAGGDLTPEIWVAPTLQYLPVRIRLTDGGGNWVDLTLEKPPLQAAAAK